MDGPVNIVGRESDFSSLLYLFNGNQNLCSETSEARFDRNYTRIYRTGCCNTFTSTTQKKLDKLLGSDTETE